MSSQATAEVEASPDELEAALNAIRNKRQADKLKAELEADAVPGYPKKLYNPTYKFEQISVARLDENGAPVLDARGAPMQSANYRRFSNGEILAKDPEDEAWLRQVCPARLFPADTEELQTCSCGWSAYSLAAVTVCLRSH